MNLLERLFSDRSPARRWVRSAGLTAFIAIMGCAMNTRHVAVQGLDHPVAPETILESDSGRDISFDELIGQLAASRLIYVGEQHTNPRHHAIQLQILQALLVQKGDLSVGMEMFDRTYQSKLDQWSAGDLEWPAFLKQVHWYANWKYKADLYKDILLYIQARGLKLVGLNIPFCLPPKIALGGVDSLSLDERAMLPGTIDTSHAEHRAYVEEVFKMHQFPGQGDFDTFYQAQCAWEDGMAQSIADGLEAGSMVVLTGNGHIIRKFGIPERAFKRTQAPFRTVYLATPDSPVSRQDGDFIWISR